MSMTLLLANLYFLKLYLFMKLQIFTHYCIKIVASSTLILSSLFQGLFFSGAIGDR